MSTIVIIADRRMTKAELDAQEKAVFENFEDSGWRLLKIKLERGWEAGGYASFREYTQYLSGKYGSVGRMFYLMDQAAVNHNLTEALGRPVNLPAAHALALKDLEPEKQVEAFNEVLKGHKKGEPKPTEKVFQRIANKIAPASKKKGKKKPARDASSGWSAEDLKADEEVATALKVIESVYGAEDTKAIRQGTLSMKRADLLMLAKLPKETMKEIQDVLFETRWTPAECLKFLNTQPDENSTVEDLKHLCLGTKGKFWEGDFHGFKVT